ncbi:transcription factor IIIB, Bdp1 subunit [Aspergillus heteromorphus CBS 117.55]|uniref:Transcription factor IIIB, Bdp1 subunit n=1 Tax=Aspergillus heteromorphus CBS 117.55 TaxID=1448321 RepID=A0A317WB12_9EURO|nr:transcription factor IIIB, Bdp1 subunit [Aspergillus heteromorphus CBS 117.55]PWY82981.1 transcription factor IIIB, Bdp1 subunit [Aspergillus heteromorphus CBS 117.55]
MKSFSSSVINKSGKKFAPKAPARRAPAQPAPPRRPSVASQPSASASQTPQPQPPTETATPESAPPPPTQPPVPAEPSIPNEPSVAPKEDAVPPRSATAIPIPRPKRKASVSIAAPVTTEELPTPPQSTPPIPAPSDISVEQAQVVPDVGTSAPPSQTHLPAADDATEIRPSKRPKTTTNSTAIPKPTSAATSTAPTLTHTLELGPTDTNPQLITPPATQATATDSEETTESRARAESQSTTAGQTRKPTRARRKSVKDGNDESAAGKKKEKKTRTRKKREPTPEGSENVEIAPGLVKMSELCKDMRTGRMSKRETELRNMEQAELERKQKAQEEGDTEAPVKQNTAEASPAEPSNDTAGNKAPAAGPVMRIVNGEIVLDTASLQVDRHADAARNADLEDVVENSLTRKINQATYGKRSKTESWDEEMTDLFYRGLRMFGTDFMMISKFFPGRSRRQIKLKFNNEERRDPQRIKETLLGPREAIDINTYSEMTNTVYDDPKVIQQQLDEEKQQIEEQHAKEKQAQEEMLRNPDGGTDGNNDAPAKVKRVSKKQAMKAMAGGTEEVLGTIDDM